MFSAAWDCWERGTVLTWTWAVVLHTHQPEGAFMGMAPCTFTWTMFVCMCTPLCLCLSLSFRSLPKFPIRILVFGDGPWWGWFKDEWPYHPVHPIQAQLCPWVAFGWSSGLLGLEPRLGHLNASSGVRTASAEVIRSHAGRQRTAPTSLSHLPPGYHCPRKLNLNCPGQV